MSGKEAVERRREGGERALYNKKQVREREMGEMRATVCGERKVRKTM